MTGCSVPLCAASSPKGVRCFRFPREKARRRKWKSCVKRDRWKASHTSRICERSRSDESAPHLELLRLIVEVPPLQVLRQILMAGVSDQEGSGTEDTQANPISEQNVHDRLDNTVDIVTVHTGEEAIPENIPTLLRKGPKYGIEPSIPAHELVALNRRVANKAEKEDQERCLLEGVDCLLKCAPRT
ncbi:hypothetical protein HPB47_006283, partial [Ixodes persulcatus]